MMGEGGREACSRSFCVREFSGASGEFISGRFSLSGE